MLATGAAALVWPRVDTRTLPGVRVAGLALAPTTDPRPQLLRRAAEFRDHFQIKVSAGPYTTRATPAMLGSELPVEAMAARLLAHGRSGDPFRDLLAVAGALTGGHDFAWAPHTDRVALGRFVQTLRARVERPPVAGATDGQGWSIAGEPGVSFNAVGLQALLERALRTGQSAVRVPLRDVPAPTAVAIGSPDAVLYDEQDPQDTGGPWPGTSHLDRVAEQARGRVARWAAEQGPQCNLEPPYERFCQGPRRVPAPTGAAAELARTLELGEPQTVGHLLRAPPRPAWQRAAGQPTDGRLLWPVPGGRLWRGFGFVRREELRHKLHRGVDIGAPEGTPIRAAGPGLVAYADNGIRGYGNLLVLIHPDGAVTLHAHCAAIYVFPGQQVLRGQIVGEVGDTGIARGSHLHFEYHRDGAPVDPADRFYDGG